MYQLRVMKAGDDAPFEKIDVARSRDVLAMLPTLLETHHDCERIVVLCQGARLFSVDCKGNRLPD